jgi:hypothetical protein
VIFLFLSVVEFYFAKLFDLTLEQNRVDICAKKQLTAKAISGYTSSGLTGTVKVS